MTRSELISRLKDKHPNLTALDVELVVKTIFDCIGRQLSQEGRLEIRGFGSFSTHVRQSRIGRNPKTGNLVHVPGKNIPHFKPGGKLRARVNACRGNQ
jgi:integration host factor subunit beta